MSVIGQRQLFLQHLAQTTEGPLMLEVERAEGVYLYTPEGQQVIDFISGISVSNLGHRHPRVVEAVKNQVDKYMHLMCYGEVIQTPQVQFAKKLTDLLPENLETVFFVNSGSEANEGALKVAKRFTGRHKMVSCYKAYHGSSHGCLSVMGDEHFKQAYRPLIPGVSFMNYNNLDDLSMIDEQTACVIIEPIQGEAGVITPNEGYLQALRKRCDETGALLIFDEVQTGFGRTGTMFGYQQTGVVPDIITFAKGMGGGMPIGAFISSHEIMSKLSHNPILGHISTFGGHPVSCAAGLALLEELIDTPSLIETAESKGQLIKDRLSGQPLIKAIRGTGLFLAIEFESSEMRENVMKAMQTGGVMTDTFIYKEDCIRIAPPLVITEEQINDACDTIISVLNDFNK